MEIQKTDESDSRLIGEFVSEHSEAAFTALVQRHMGLVYGVAMRATGNHSVAQEIVQNVFLQLAKKAIWLQDRETLASWLHRAALLESREWWRSEIRRAAREQMAVKLETTMKTSDEVNQVCVNMIDEALLQLRDAERRAVLLRYFEGRNHREIAADLGIGEDAVRKRIDKSLAIMAAFFRKRGYAVSAAGVLAAAASAHSAPVALVATVVKTSLAIPATHGIVASLFNWAMGVKRVHLVWACIAIVGIPVVWQQAMLKSANEERERLLALLTSIDQQRADIDVQAMTINRQLREFSNQMAFNATVGRSVSNGQSNWADPSLFRWDEHSAFVRVPKASLQWLSIDPSNNTWSVGSYPGRLKPVISQKGELARPVLQVLGLTEKEQAQLQDHFYAWVEEYKKFTDSQARAGGAELLEGPLPDFVVTNAETRVWKIPAASENVAGWKKEFLAEMDSIIGPERSKAFMFQASGEGSIARVFQDFGETAPTIVLTPSPEGGCRLARSVPRDGHPRWSGVNVAITYITAQTKPEELQWMEDFLTRPVPPALMDYLRDWWQAHPQTPDKPLK